MLSQRSRYALRAMLRLADAEPGQPVPMSRIAADALIPRKFCEVILAELRDGGLVISTRGKQGGFRLARLPHLVSFGDIVRVTEGQLALVPCVSRVAYRRCEDCVDEGACAIRRAMLVVRDETARILDGTSLADSAARELVVAA